MLALLLTIAFFVCFLLLLFGNVSLGNVSLIVMHDVAVKGTAGKNAFSNVVSCQKVKCSTVL